MSTNSGPETVNKPKTSRLAIYSIATAILAMWFCLMDFIMNWGFLFLVAAFVLMPLAFLFGIAAIVVIALNRSKLKGDSYALISILLSIPFFLLMGTSAYVNKVRSERLANIKLEESKKPGTLMGHSGDNRANACQDKAKLGLIRVDSSGRHFVYSDSNSPYRVWGLNYDHDRSGRLLEDYWIDRWDVVAEDFNEMKTLGANVVRVHLQVAKFMKTAHEPNLASLKQLVRLLALAEDTGLWLDITGLGCYHKKDVPKWYDQMNEADRWDVQARFWAAVSKTCAKSNAVFCYDLMNEPIVPADKKETDC